MATIEPDERYDIIFSAARECDIAFRNISSFDSNSPHATLRISVLFEPRLRLASKAPITLSDVCDDYEQFRVWARNTGVFATGHASLDFRLRDAIDLRDGFVSLLRGLATELVNCLQLLNSDLREAPMTQHGDSTDSSSESSECSQVDTEVPYATKRTANELQLRFRHIGAVVDRLIRLAAVIRGSSTNSRTTKAANYVHYEDGINVSEQFEKQYLPLVLKHRFNLDEPILTRFVKAISLRRRRFMYEMKHQKALAFGGEIDESAVNRVTPSNAVSRSAFNTLNVIPNEQRAPENRSLVSTPTQATTFQLLDCKPKAPSRIVSASTKTGSSSIDLPPPPRMADRATHFQCPYCCILLPRQKSLPKHWRNHLIEDLQPWICLEPDCTNPDITLTTREDWIRHQRWEHAMEWWCDNDGDENGNAVSKFLTAEAYVEHLRNRGGDIDVQSLNRKIVTSGRPSLTPFSCCPLCDFQPQAESQTTHEQNADLVDINLRRQKELQQHIANDLLTIFRIALPGRRDLGDDQTETNSAAQRRSSVQPFSNSSLYLDHSAGHGEESYHDITMHDATQDNSATKTIHEQLEQREVFCDPAFSESIWHAVWVSPELQSSVRSTYTGLDEDIILQSFISNLAGGSEHEKKVDFMPPPEAYTVAWLSNRHFEFASASLVFDERHRSLNITGTDYICGRIGQLNVVLAFKTAKGEQDAGSMDKLIFGVLEDFPSIKVLLLVGTGISPLHLDNENRVIATRRPGDVIVGFRGENKNAETFLDLEKDPSITLQSINAVAPPMWATRAIQKIRLSKTQDPGNEGSHLLFDHITSMSRDDMALQFGQVLENHETDITEVHYGLIASTSATSDKQKLRALITDNRSISCFEDATYRLNGHVPCVNIRGIRRPAEDGMGDLWQDYAACTAALYAKELINAIDTADVNSCPILTGMHRVGDREALLRYEGMYDTWESIADRHVNTREWLHESPEFCEWMTGSSKSILYLHGTKGAGKSTIMKANMNTMSEKYSSESLFSISFFFSSQGSTLQRSLAGMYRTLLLELCQKHHLADEKFVLKLDLESVGLDLLITSQTQILETIFYAAIRDIRHVRILIFVDGVENCLELHDDPNPASRLAARFWKAGFTPGSQHRLCISTNRRVDLAQDMIPGLLIALDRRLEHQNNLFGFIKTESLKYSRPSDKDNLISVAFRGNYMFGIIFLGLMSSPKYHNNPYSHWEEIHSNLRGWVTGSDKKPEMNPADLKTAGLLLQHKVVNAIDIPQHKRSGLLKLAMFWRDLQAVRLLLEGSDAEIFEPDNSASIILNSVASSQDIINLVFSHPGIDVNAQGRYGTPLFNAIALHKVHQVSRLLAHPKINVNMRNPAKESALHCAVTVGNYALVQLFLTHTNIDVNLRDQYEFTALDIAIENSRADIITLLLSHPNIQWVLTTYTNEYLPDVPDDIRTKLLELSSRSEEQVVLMK